jgi:curved DNA-binding protein CbpA
VSVPDPYKTLQVDPEAEDEVIEAAYRRLARKYHPDVSPDPESQERMVRINQAWEQLRDPVRRAAVDRARSRTAGTAARVGAADARAATSEARARAADHPATPPPSGGHTTMPPPAAYAQPAAPGAGSAGIWSSGGPAGAASAFPGVSDPAAGGFGPPPGNPSGSVLNFGRYTGWSLGEIARVDLEYLEWLSRMPIGLTYRSELDELLRAHGRRAGVQGTAGQNGLYRRR